MVQEHNHDFVENDPKLQTNQNKTMIVVVITFITMIVEVLAGYFTGSMALLADGWHMASHAFALGVAVLSYRLARSRRLKPHFSFGLGKVIPLGGYTSSILLTVMAILMMVESVRHLITPQDIAFDEAIWIALIGLAVNVVSAFILHDKDHHHGHSHDHNLKGAYIHVMTDALTSVLAIAALLCGKYFGWNWMDALMGILGGILILKWAIGLILETSWELLDGHAKDVDRDAIQTTLEDSETKVIDLHVWRIAPNAHATEIIIRTNNKKGPDFYRKILKQKFNLDHVIVEEVD